MTRPGETEAAWEAVLDGLDAAADALSESLGAGETPAAEGPWAPPAELGPIPAALRPRASAVLERLQAAQISAQARLEALTDELVDIEQRRRAGRAYAS